MDKVIKVGMADLKTTKSPGILITLGLGSCIGICLYDPVTKVSGMAHIMLPSSKSIKNNKNIYKFADTGIEKLINEMVAIGAVKRRMISKIAGGAQMFSFSSKNDIMKIGERNAIAVKKILKEFNIPIKAEDTGGNYGRTIEFHSLNGKLLVKTIGHGVREI
ncbi:chemotaxis protein CheD [Maledivibacter halophilus]|uniref:Probable chemoreceptor glutamine deamidase CheD n=1 Tax=Maledivibacter halophilus TaxID=36842 RepID=A0A1T5LDV4_9FIRM|nr:chemotaxis protein CheD [Maledivibacter halophilus]SKC74216.1 chemotaxis protein CheD [Maledivibacter halophilus]